MRSVKEMEWFLKRPEMMMREDHHEIIEVCGGCAAHLIFRSNGNGKCYHCGFNGKGVHYVKQEELDNQV
jgi:hypothetical protein